jgi:Type II/IV secretion system protein
VVALVQRVVAPLGLRVDESRPWVDARLPGGERFHAVLPPLAPDGPVVTIRTFARRRLELRDLIDRGALDVATARLLEAMVAAGIAIAVSGATGTGKTTLLNVLERHLFVSGEPKAPLCYLPSAARVPRGANAVAHPTPCGLSRGGLLLEHSSGDSPRHLRCSLGAGRGISLDLSDEASYTHGHGRMWGVREVRAG